MLTCTRCSASFPVDQRQGRCLFCPPCFSIDQRERTNRSYRKNKTARDLRQKEVRDKNKQLSDDYKRQLGCADCGERDPVVLEYDHLRDKVKDVSILVGSSRRWETILKEIDKCEVVCANCHRRRTHYRKLQRNT